MSDPIILQCLDVLSARLNALKTDTGQDFVVAEVLSDRSQIRSYPALVLVRGDARTGPVENVPSRRAFPYPVNIQGYLQAPTGGSPEQARRDAELYLAEIEHALFPAPSRFGVETLDDLCDELEYTADGVDLNSLSTNIIRVDVILTVRIVRSIGNP